MSAARDEPRVLNLGCGGDHQDDALNVDASTACDPDVEYDLTDYPWPWEGVTTIRMYHVLEHLPDMHRALSASSDCLRSGGQVVVKLPMGRDAYADDTHQWGKRGLPWTWRTPEYAAGKRHWQEDIELNVEDRDVRLWAVHPSNIARGAAQALWRWKLRRYGPGEWCFGLPQSCGEFTVVYRKP